MFFRNVWASNPNYFAAIPSLHGAYPVFLLLMLGAHHRYRWLVVGYGLGLWLATVVLGHHYIIDLILGALYAGVSAWVVNHYQEKILASAITHSENQVAEEVAV
jgi:membrane-associated phospholipid phosphatase